MELTYPQLPSEPPTTIVALGQNGRLVVPASIRKSLQLEEGDQFILDTDTKHTLQLQKLSTFVSQAEGLYADYARGTSVVDELIAERRAEAEQETAKESSL